MLEEDCSRGTFQNERESSVIYLLFQLSDSRRHSSVICEAFQGIRFVAHNYPSLVNKFWGQISATVNEILHIGIENSSYEVGASLCKEENSIAFGASREKCTMTAIKVLDEGLRAVSGFKGADEFIDSKLLDIQYISDSTRSKRISSAPSYELVDSVASSCSTNCSSGIEQWDEVIVKHLPKSLSHASPTVRAASVTCFAGLTSGVFSSLTKDKEDLVVSSVVHAALNDAVPSVRSAACRAIGVITCFPEIVTNSEVLNEIIHAVDFNSRDPVVSVRITASWALANICDSLRHKATGLNLESCEGEITYSKYISSLAESALRLTRDGDKVKSNAVRALGNLSRFIRLTKHSGDVNGTSGLKTQMHEGSHWLERMVQALVSCVTTGNVKVQWNVCYALSNLFRNDTLKLHDMPWASTVYSILLLLLRDSTNYKIRIHAAIALAVPTTRLDYGSSFSDIVQSLEHVQESLVSDNATSPSSFKYKDNLEKQISLTMLHVLGFVSTYDDQALNDFLIKKASFLEEWFKLLSPKIEADDQPSAREGTSSEDKEDGLTSFAPNKLILSKALKSLLEVYKGSNHPTIARRFEKLENILL